MESLPLLFCVRCSSFSDRFDDGEIIPCIDSSRENAMRQLCCLCWQKINIKRYGGSPAALFCVRCSSFPNRLDAGGAIRCTDSGRENAMWQSCRLRWQKINIKRYGWKLYRFAFRGCSSFPDGFARLELSALAAIRCTNSGKSLSLLFCVG